MRTSIHLSLCLTLLSTPLTAQDVVIPSGSSVWYDTERGPVRVDSLTIESGARLHVRGSLPFWLEASDSIVIHGELDCSGEDAADVFTLNTTSQPEPGAAGGPGGGAGGTGSRGTSTSTPQGSQGRAPASSLGLAGGGGGETTFALGVLPDNRRAAGGGGGVLGPVQLEHPDLEHPSNRGMIAQRGGDGAPAGLGALSQLSPAAGGSVGVSGFVDGNDGNDFWGRRLDTSASPPQVIAGELLRPIAGQGGGAGGDAVNSSVFPPLSFDPGGDEKGAGGGGGGGLCVLRTQELVVHSGGRILADGGHGGSGENTQFMDRIGGSSGGGSGGMIIIQAELLDLHAASSEALSARGGYGGASAVTSPLSHAGGDGGPGLIQLHTPDGTLAAVTLPAAMGLDDLSAPNALVMLPAFP